MGAIGMTQDERMPRRERVRTRARAPLWREALGGFLRAERLEQERILADVARDAGVSTQYLSEIERGRKEPSSEILAAVAGALGLTLLDITAGVAADLAARAPRAIVLDLTARHFEDPERRARLVPPVVPPVPADAGPGASGPAQFLLAA